MLKIFFKPPPPLDGHGTAYMPDEFHHEIRLLLALPPLESASPRALTQRQFTGEGLAQHERVTIFGDLVEECLTTCYRQRNGTNDDRKTIVALLMNSNFVGTDDLLVELKLWTCMTDHVRSYMVDRYHYLIELERRCSAWDKVCIVTSVVADNFPTTLFSTSPWEPTRFYDSSRATSSTGSGSDGNSDSVLPLPSLGVATGANAICGTTGPETGTGQRILLHFLAAHLPISI
ncbi:hypothetical protein DFH09DRAFT_1322646 [Mycena vulgaris]|nr:hypothetical protein DFH09DRAFT_1322646 [Mycena vulgaris]